MHKNSAKQGDSGETFELTDLASEEDADEAPRGKRKPNATKPARAKAAE
jgi:hypothetical protein